MRTITFAGSALRANCPYIGDWAVSCLMDFFRAAILGIVQGLAEFLPISSSGHLILVPALFRWPDQGLSFDVGLHVGTLLALLVYFWRDWYRMFRSGLIDLRDHGFAVRHYTEASQLLWLLALGSIPAAIAGLLFNDWIEENVRQAWLVAVAMGLVGVLLLAADVYGARVRTMSKVGVVDAIIIGVAQACALIPGVSRSGATMTAGLYRGFARNDAARFAFLLGTPAFVGAALFKAKDFAADSSQEFGQLAVGFVFSAVVGFLVIHWLLRYLRTKTLVPFVVYRWGVAVLTLAIAAARV